MPLVKISLVKGPSRERKTKISEEIHAALVESIKIPQTDFNHRIFEFDPADIHVSAGKTDKFVLVEITMFPGRSKEAKRRLFKGVTDRLGALGIPASDVLIVLEEPPLGNWGLGGVPGDEANIGFELKV
jgi:phenylpyruvate tautomerase PptA (4-oxalocrotonate tautomerase family)